jgi:hypothetical protein
MGGEAHPIGRAVNIFLVILVIANGLAFACGDRRFRLRKMEAGI